MSETFHSTARDRAEAWREPLGEGRFGEAYNYYLAKETQDPAERRALATLADIEALVRNRSWQQARRKLDRLEERPPLLDWELFERELDILKHTGQELDRRNPEDVLEELRAVALPCFQAEVETQRGTALVFLGRSAEARSCFQRALAIDAKHYRAITNLGNISLEEGLVDEAIAAYEQAIAVNDAFANAHHNLGVAYRRKGQYGKSIRALRKAQSVMQRREAEETRASLARASKGQGMRVLRWLLYGAVALALFILLRNRGII